MRRIWFVSHPDQEPKILSKKICPWNVSSQHKRKLIESKEAHYITTIGGPMCKGTIYFAGEWECCSFFTRNSFSTSVFKNIHIPIFTELDSHSKVLNTDPFVLGKKFYYVCCKKRAKMKAGDMVIFGRSSGVNNSSLHVDTVLIIEGKVNRFYNQQVFFPSGYNEVTLSKMPLNEEVIVGQMYEDNKDVFSFVPCRTDSDFKFPIITVQHNGVDLHGGRQSNCLSVNDTDFMVIYSKLMNDIISQGYYLGVFMPMPIFNARFAPKSPEDYDYNEYYGRSSHMSVPLADILR